MDSQRFPLKLDSYPSIGSRTHMQENSVVLMYAIRDWNHKLPPFQAINNNPRIVIGMGLSDCSVHLQLSRIHALFYSPFVWRHVPLTVILFFVPIYIYLPSRFQITEKNPYKIRMLLCVFITGEYIQHKIYICSDDDNASTKINCNKVHEMPSFSKGVQNK